MEDGLLCAEYTICHKKTHSQTLMPMISEISRMAELDLQSLHAIAVAGGPGSFTGLRIGSASAKGIADVLGIPIVSVPTVDALAYNLFGTRGLIVPMMDARRSQVYTGLYRFDEDNRFLVEKEQWPAGIEELISILNEKGETVTFLGDGVPVFRELLDKGLSVHHCYAPAHLARQRAGAVGALAVEYFREGRYTSAADHRPVYLRKSQAERVRDEKAAVLK